MSNTKLQHYWKRQLRLIFVLLAIWFIVGLLMSIILIEPLNQFKIFGTVPFGFWMAQQGSIYIFVVLIFVYAYLSNKHDHEEGLSEDDANTSTITLH